jgi:hypothetical protein
MGWLYCTLGDCWLVEYICLLAQLVVIFSFLKGFLFLYVVYILVVIFGRYINQKIKRKNGIVSNRNEFSSNDDRTVVANIDVNNVEHDEVFPSDDQHTTINDEETDERRPLMGGEDTNEVIVKYPLSVTIRKALRTFTKSEWDESNIFMKIFLIIQVYLFLCSSLFFKHLSFLF